MKTVIGTLLISALLVALAIGAMIYSGCYNFAADTPHWAVTEQLVSSARHRSVALRADDIDVPADLDDPRRLVRAASHYQPMCSGCHLAPGMAGSELRDGLYPQPPNLAEHGIHNPQTAFWTIKHGIKMSAMPAWGGSHDDESLWDLVALLQAMPQMSEGEWMALQAAEGGRTPEEGDGHDHHHGHQH